MRLIAFDARLVQVVSSPGNGATTPLIELHGTPPIESTVASPIAMGAMLQLSHRFRSLSSYSNVTSRFFPNSGRPSYRARCGNNLCTRLACCPGAIVRSRISFRVVSSRFAFYSNRLLTPHLSQIAQIWAQDNLDIAKARDSYVRAGEWYKQEEANA